MDSLKTVFGIDVSSRKSNVCIMVNGQKVNDYAISNDMVGFNQLLGDLKQVTKPQKTPGVLGHARIALCHDESARSQKKDKG